MGGVMKTTVTKNRYWVRSTVMFIALLGILGGGGQAKADHVYEGTQAAITAGYGAFGPYTVATDTVRNPKNPNKPVTIFYPSGLAGPLPTIFFAHAYGATDYDTYLEMLQNLASNGYVVVFVPYRSTGITSDQRYEQLWSGFTTAAKVHRDLIDTTRVGFFGHSFGGGAVPEMARRAFVDNGWGSKGRFMFMAAPWYSLQITEDELQAFPADAKLLVEVYDQDVTNDHRMAIDIFSTINSAIEKNYLRILADTHGDYTFVSDHMVPGQAGNSGVYNGYDYWGVFRRMQALADYAFNGTPAARDIVFGTGSDVTDMGLADDGTPMALLDVTATPAPLYPQEQYLYPCNNPSQNPRYTYCAP
jgi:pimeloyl-ACP methyl ester carboxylesterase